MNGNWRGGVCWCACWSTILQIYTRRPDRVWHDELESVSASLPAWKRGEAARKPTGGSPLDNVLPDGRLHRRAVEHSVVDHCNLTCDGCDHGSPLLRKRFASVEQFSWSLSRLSRVLFVDRLKLLGGEPLLHPEIGEFARVAKKSGVAGEIQIWTNGTLVHRMERSQFKHVDRLVISQYPSVKLPIEEEELRSILSDFGCQLSVRRVDEFIKCFPDEKREDMDHTHDIFKSCKNTGEWSCHSFQDGYYFKCSRAHFLRGRAFGGASGELSFRDGIRLDMSDLRSALATYLESEVPLTACGWCLGTSGQAYPHRLIPRRSTRFL